MFNISFLKTFLITRLLITQLPDMVLIIPYPPMVSIHPDKFIYSGTFSFVRLCCVGGPRMTVLFICSLRCSVCSSLKMESKAAGKMEPPRPGITRNSLFCIIKRSLEQNTASLQYPPSVISFTRNGNWSKLVLMGLSWDLVYAKLLFICYLFFDFIDYHYGLLLLVSYS